MAEFVIHGIRELALNLERFPEQLKRKAMDRVMRRGGRYISLLAKELVPVRSGSGALKRSIRVAIVRRGDFITARVIAGRNRKKDDPYYAWMVEGGTEPHEIRPKGRKSLFFAGLSRTIVKHPGARPRPYLRPALEQGADTALALMRDELADQIERLGGSTL
jgi:HK97 gp10 family phage protein